MRYACLVSGLAFLLAMSVVPAVNGAGAIPEEDENPASTLLNGDNPDAVLAVPGKDANEAVYQQALQLWRDRNKAKDAGDVVVLLRRAAENGHAPSQNLLGSFYDTGSFVERDPVQALKWYEAAAAQGLTRAQLNAGLTYRTGEGVPRDEAKALRYFEQAARGSSREAQYMLAVMLEDGIAGRRDPEGAVAWYKRAADQGYGPAQHNLAVAYATGSGVARSEQAAAHWYRQAAGNGQAKSQLLFGMMLAEGRGVKRDDTQAYVWLNIAAANGWKDEALRGQAMSLAAIVAKRLSAEQLARAQKEIAAKLTSRG